MARRKVRSVFHDLYPADQAAEMEMRSQLLSGLSRWLTESGMTQVEAAKGAGSHPGQDVGSEAREDQSI